MDEARKKQETELYEYVYQELRRRLRRELTSLEISALAETINIIMDRYDLFDCEDEPRGPDG